MKKIVMALTLVMALVGTVLLGCPVAQAAGGLKAPSVVGTPSTDNLDEQLFVITNPNAEAITVEYGTTARIGDVTIPANGKTTVSVSDPGMSGCTLYVKYGDDGYVFAKSLNSYYVYIIYRCQGETLESLTKTVSKNAPLRWDAPEVLNGKYQLASNSPLSHSFNPSSSKDQRTLVFEYELIVPKPYDITVNYLDRATNDLLDSVSVTVPVDGTASFQAPEKLSANGGSYALASGQSGSVSHAYADGSKTYTVYYDRQPDAPAKPYRINIRYQDTATGLVLASQNVTVPVGETVTFQVQDRVISSQGLEYRRAEGQPASIVHEANNATRSYVILFNQVATATEPYDIAIIYADAATGAELERHTEHVALQGTARHSAPPTMTKNGVGYTVAVGSNRTITHNFANQTRVYYVYYNADGADPVRGYNITVRYVDSSDNHVLQTHSVTVPVRGEAQHIAPIELLDGDTRYYLAAGQGQTLTHDFADARRVYNIFYRASTGDVDEDIPVIDNTNTNDTPDANVDDNNPAVVDDQENVVPVAAPETEEETTTPAAAVTITEPTIPQAANADAPQQITDPSVPLAAGGEQPASSGSLSWLWLLIPAVVAAGGVVAFLVTRQRRKGKA